MASQQIILLVINILGGIAVLGSYIILLRRAGPNAANAMWGGVSPAVRPVYVVSMLLSALGYIAFFYFTVFKLVPAEVKIAGGFGYSLFYAVFPLILIPSALWMPLTNAYVGNPGTALWVGVRVVLAIVGLASIALLWALLALQTQSSGIAYWLAVAGSGYFAFHTAVLDALVWSALFHRQ